jgi:hypothetical protein
LLLALPLAALAAAWRGRRARIGKASVRLRQAALDTAPILAVVALGYLAAVFAQLAVSGLPLTLTTNLGIPLAYACLSAGAISLGYALGSVVQVAVSAPVAFLVVAGYFRVVPNGWQNLTGGSVMQTGYTLYHEVLPGSLVSMTVIGLAVVGMGCLVVAARPILPRLLTLGAVLLASVAIVPLVGAPALAAVGTGSSLARDPAQLVCSGTDPEICLWPEQDAEGGAEIREAHTDAYRDARALGVGVPSHIASEWGYGYDRPDSTGLAWRYSQSPDELLVNYAVVALLPSFSCHAARTDVSHPRAQQVVTYAFALAIGADGTLAMPTLSAVTEGDDAPLGFAESQDYLGVHDLAEARTVLRDWVAAPVC